MSAMLRFLTAAAGLVATCSLSGAAVCAEPAPTALPFYPADAVRGRGLATVCLACHGPAATTSESQRFHTPRLSGQRPDSIFDALLEYKSGARHSESMAAIAATLNTQDMRDVAAYLAGAQVKPSPATVPESTARERVRDDCAACHGETGLGIMPGYPVIGGQYADYLVYSLKAFKSGTRTNPTMTVIARGLSDSDIRDLAQFFEERGYLRNTE